MNILKYLFCTASFFCCTLLLDAQQTSLRGKLTDTDTGEAIMFANVALYKNEIFYSGVESNLDGNYSFENIESGIYDIQTSFIGYNTTKLKNQVIYSGETNTIDLTMSEGAEPLDSIQVINCGAPLIKQGESAVGEPVSVDDIKNLPKRNINGKSLSYYIDSELITDHMTPREKRKQRRKIAKAKRKAKNR